MNLPKVATVILHYGKIELTQRLHAQLKEKNEQIFVLDNCSPHPYPAAWLRLEQNLFWAGALDYCLHYFQNQGYDYLWFLNNDLYFVSNLPIVSRVRARLAYLEKKYAKIGIYSPCVSQNPYHAQMVKRYAQGWARVAYVDGIALLINLQCFNELKELDYAENVYGYGVDIWLSYRASQLGWFVVVDQEVEVKHFYHYTAKNVTGFLARARQVQQKYLKERLGPNFKTQLDAFQKIIEPL